MTSEKVQEVAQIYLDRLGVDAQRLDDRRAHAHYDRLCHLAWMCAEIQRMARDAAPDDHAVSEKVMRWLGFVQGALWQSGFYSVDELRKHNMPSGEEFRGRFQDNPRA